MTSKRLKGVSHIFVDIVHCISLHCARCIPLQRLPFIHICVSRRLRDTCIWPYTVVERWEIKSLKPLSELWLVWPNERRWRKSGSRARGVRILESSRSWCSVCLTLRPCVHHTWPSRHAVVYSRKACGLKRYDSDRPLCVRSLRSGSGSTCRHPPLGVTGRTCSSHQIGNHECLVDAVPLKYPIISTFEHVTGWSDEKLAAACMATNYVNTPH